MIQAYTEVHNIVYEHNNRIWNAVDLIINILTILSVS